MVETFKSTRRIAAILGFLHKGEVDAIFKQQPFETEQDVDPFNLWEESRKAIQNLPPTPPATFHTLDERIPVIAEVKERERFKKYYERVADYRFALVPVNALLAPQWHADMDYIDELSATFAGNLDLESQIYFSMTESAISAPVINGSQVIFSSARRDLHADQVPVVRESSPGEFEIVIRASSRPNYICAAEIGSRLLLTNGVHKVCAMAKVGYTAVPCLLRQIGRIEESGLMLQSSLFRPDLLAGVRPAQVIDFLSNEVAVPLRLRSMHQMLRVGIGVDLATIPAVSSQAWR